MTNTTMTDINYKNLCRNLTKVNYHLLTSLEESEGEIQDLSERNLALQSRNERLQKSVSEDEDTIFDLRTDCDILKDRVEELERIARSHGALCTRCGTLLILSRYNDPDNPYDADSLEDHLGGICSGCAAYDSLLQERKSACISAGAD